MALTSAPACFGTSGLFHYTQTLKRNMRSILQLILGPAVKTQYDRLDERRQRVPVSRLQVATELRWARYSKRRIKTVADHHGERIAYILGGGELIFVRR